MTEEAFALEHLRRNTLLYSAAILANGLAYPFGDPSVLVSNLALKLGAPGWLAVFPTVSIFTVAYLPLVFVAWAMRPSAPYRKLYALALVPMQLPWLLLAAALIAAPAGRAPALMLGACTALSALGQGLTILPCWCLFARIFPADRRGGIMGRAVGLSQLAGLAGSAGAAWLVSPGGPLPYPFNYALSLAIFVAGGGVFVVFLLRLRERPPPRAEDPPRLPLRAYVAALAAPLRGDSALRRVLGAAVFGAALFGISPLFLVHAKTLHGFTDRHVSLLMAARPWLIVPSAFAAGHLAPRVGERRIVAFLAALLLAAAALAPFAEGLWQLAPLLLSLYAPLLYSFVLVTVMNAAPAAGRTADAMTLFYMVVLIPSLAPLLFSALLPRAPAATMAAVGACALAAAWRFLRLRPAGPARPA